MTQNTSRTKTAAALLIAALLSAHASTSAAQAQAPAERAAALDELNRCRAVADGTERLACYDRAASALDQAERSGDVVVLDRAQVRETRRRLFGLNLDSVNIFNRGERPEQVESVSSTLARAWGGERGRWTFELADGSVWRQIDDEPLRTTPRPGSTVAVRRAAVGSYFMNVNGARALRVSRDR